LKTTGKWQPFPALAYRAQRNGSQLGAAVVKQGSRRGNRFRVKTLVIERARSLASAPAHALALGTQFQCNWTFYTDAARVAVLDKLRAAGVEWVRIDTGWSGIEAARKGDRNAWYLRMVDFCVDEAHKRGLKVLVTLWLTPGWANGGRSDKAPPTNPQDYADFARWAAAHWKGRVAAWQVWNEPDPGQPYFAGTLAEYVALLKAAYPAFKAGDPNALVVLGGPSSNDDGWISQLYALGAKGSFDVLATHPYQGIADAPPEHPDDGNRWWFTHLPAVRQVMLRHGDGAKPIWFTEFGWSAHSNWPGIANWQRGVSPEQQGEYLLRAIRYTKANYPYVPVMFWYKERANPLSSDPHYEGYALLNADLSERPVYRALKAFLNSR
jgi:polysaccharide biosynthesis protein PslG